MSNKLKVAFVGCSLTRGDGFDAADLDQTWPRIVAEQFMLDADNLAVSGASNHRIFMQTCQAIQSGQYDLVFAQWTALNRLWLSPGPGVWYYTTGDGRDTFEYRHIHLSQRDKNDLARHILLLNHDYQNILDLVDYVNTVCDLADHHKTTVVHVNGLVPWSADLINPSTDFDTLSDYTREMLDFDQRDDAEIHELLVPLKHKMQTLDLTRWVNPWQSFVSLQQDLGPQGHHPGPCSHADLAQRVADHLQQGNL